MTKFIYALLFSIVIHLFVFFYSTIFFDDINTHYSSNEGFSKMRGNIVLYENVEKQLQKQKSEKKQDTGKQIDKIKQRQNLESPQIDSHATGNENLGNKEDLSAYLTTVRDKIAKNKFKNMMAKRLKLTGKVKLNFTIQSPNLLRDIYISETSNFPLIDESAKETVRTVRDLPIIPASLNRDEIDVSLVISYE